MLTAKDKLQALDLSANPISQSGAQQIANLLCQNRAVTHLGVDNCQGGEAVFIEIAKALNKTKLKSLSARNTDQHWAQHFPIREKGIKALNDALGAPGCPLEQLDLSFNNVGNVNAQQLFHCIAKSEHCPLKTLKLNDCNLGNHAIKSLVPALESTTKLEHVEIDGHVAKPKALDEIAHKIKENPNIIRFEATPNYVFAQQMLATDESKDAHDAQMILSIIKQTVAEHASEKELEGRMENLSLNDELESAQAGLRRCASVPTFHTLEQPTLRFSGQLPQKPMKNCGETIRFQKMTYV